MYMHICVYIYVYIYICICKPYGHQQVGALNLLPAQPPGACSPGRLRPGLPGGPPGPPARHALQTGGGQWPSSRIMGYLPCIMGNLHELWATFNELWAGARFRRSCNQDHNTLQYFGAYFGAPDIKKNSQMV